MLAPKLPLTDLPREKATSAEDSPAVASRSSLPFDDLVGVQAASPADDMSDYRDSSPSPHAKSLGNLLLELERLKQQRPRDYQALKELQNQTDAIPPEYQQLFHDQALALALHQASPPTQQATPPSSLSLSPPSPPSAARDRPATAIEHASSQAAPLPVAVSGSPTVSKHIGDVAPASAPVGNNVTAESVTTESLEFRSGQWREEINEALFAIETELARGQHDRAAKARLEANRRLLHVIANHPEDAVTPIKEFDSDEQEFWKHQMHSLLTSLDADGKHAASRRAALSLRELRAAGNHLANISTLDLRNVTLCTRVTSYGEFTEFESSVFRSGQEVILYVEIDNFATQSLGEQHETELHGSYQILDDAGSRVANVVLPIDRQVSLNRRRDYFIPYLITMPAKIASGSYRLQLTIEDVIGKKSNHASIDFSIR